MSISFALVTSIAVFTLSWLLTGLILRAATRLSILDHPNLRSSHTTPTPRGGGLGIVIVVLGAVVCLYSLGEMPIEPFASVLVGGIFVAGSGAADDYRHIPAGWRFLLQVIVASFAVLTLGGLPGIQVGSQVIDLGLPGDLMAIIFIVWLINLYNFMDGIDGIAAVEAICVAGSALAIMPIHSTDGYTTTLLIVFVAAVLGFLVWNWPPARIFMGDVGSGFIGFVLAMFAIISSGIGLLPIWVWLILAGVFVVDATVTLITRIILGEEWYSAHNNHAYQKAARRLKSHKSVTLAVLMINILWLLPMAWVASARPEFGWWLTIIAWLPLILLTLFLKAGRPKAAS
jgi:Fuc2NAc and GlcNAc transferase